MSTFEVIFYNYVYMFKFSYRNILTLLFVAASVNVFGARPRTKAPKLTPDEMLDSAQHALVDYRVDLAEKYLDDYEDAISSNKRLKPDEDRVEELSSLLVLTRNMLDRVEKIAVIDSIVVPKDHFFRYYKLSPEAGRLADASVLPRHTKIGYPGVVFVPENEQELIWAAPDSVHSYHLMSADRLGDGKLSDPTPLQGELNEKGNANFPFMMPDGITLYYANSGSNSLGGYDIFMTRKTDDGFLQPQNIGMPYNSPYDDYMLAIDESTGAGWWATDRNQIADSLTIYVFVPNEIRTNYSASNPDVRSFAMLSDISATQAPGADYDRIRRAINEIRPADDKKNSDEQFRFFIPGKGLYTNIDQFKSIRAQDAMEKYLQFQENISRLKVRLQDLRRQYAAGNRDVSTDIIRIERQLLDASEDAAKLASKVVQSEK